MTLAVLCTGMLQSLKIWGPGSNAARRRCSAAPSDLPKSGGAAAPPASHLGACLYKQQNQIFIFDQNWRPFSSVDLVRLRLKNSPRE